jgi:hypothetical protein
MEFSEYNKSFVLYESVFAQYHRLMSRGKTELACEYIDAVMRFGLYGEIPLDDSDIWELGFDGIIATISAAKTKYRQRINIPENELRGYIEMGYTQQKIAEHYNCSVDTVQRRIKQYNIKPQITASNYNDNVYDKENGNDYVKEIFEC